jgi:hypothetical protein
MRGSDALRQIVTQRGRRVAMWALVLPEYSEIEPRCAHLRRGGAQLLSSQGCSGFKLLATSSTLPYRACAWAARVAGRSPNAQVPTRKDEAITPPI